MMQQITKTTLPDLSLAPLAAEPLQDTRGQASSRTRHDQSLRLTSSASSSHEDSKRSEEANLTTVLPTPSTTLPIQQHSGKLTSRQVEKLRSDSTSSDTPISQTRKIPWRPSIFRAAPLTGIAALLLAFLQVFASYAVLRASNGDRITNWKYQPTVYLAILTAISNKALAFATIQGTVVTFWLTALRGTTLGQMHRDWGYGLHVWKAIAAGRHFNALALASICATFVAVDGPLLQRASSVHLRMPHEPVTLSVTIAPEVPSYFSGWTVYDSYPLILVDFTTEFLPVLKDYISGSPITGAIEGCNGTCTAIVHAPALAIDHCTSTLRPVNFTEPLPKDEVEELTTFNTAPVERWVYHSGFQALNGTIERINFTTVVSDAAVAESCVGHVNITSCTLISALAEYPVLIRDGEIIFTESTSHSRIVARANNTAVTEETISEYDLQEGGAWVQTTLGGIVAAANAIFGRSYGLIPSVSAGDTPMLAPGPDGFGLNHIANYEAWDNGRVCAPAWSDPRDDIMTQINELMFRTGVYVAQRYNGTYLRSRLDDGLEVSTEVRGAPRSPVDVFHSDFDYFAGAATIQLLTIVVVMFTFYGWWRLGRGFTLSPLEIAKAFDARLLEDVPPNHNGYQIMKFEGSRRVQYGVLIDDEAQVHDTNGSLRTAENIMIADRERVHKLEGKRMNLSEHCDSLMSIISKRITMVRSRWSA